MKKEILINCHPRENRVAVMVDGKLEQFFLERGEEQRPLGNVYKGRVTTILHGLGAAFVDIGLEKDGFLPMSETAQSSSLWVVSRGPLPGSDSPGQTNRHLPQDHTERTAAPVAEDHGGVQG